jgi:hypothetical protein
MSSLHGCASNWVHSGIAAELADDACCKASTICGVISVCRCGMLWGGEILCEGKGLGTCWMTSKTTLCCCQVLIEGVAGREPGVVDSRAYIFWGAQVLQDAELHKRMISLVGAQGSPSNNFCFLSSSNFFLDLPRPTCSVCDSAAQIPHAALVVFPDWTCSLS